MPTAFWITTLVSQALIIPLIAWWARRFAGLSPAWVLRTTAMLVIWLIAAIVLAWAGAFLPRAGMPPTIGLAVFMPIVVGLFMLQKNGVRVPETALAMLIGLQLLRVEGFEFVVAGHEGALPAQFAYPAGWGDALIGLTAPLVALIVSRRANGWRGIAIAWNLAGIADLANAVFFGVTSSPGALQLFVGPPSTELMTQLPLSLVPTFGVPLAVLGHLMALKGLWAMAPRDSARPQGASSR